ncbi:MAG: DUF4386 domain-containing protein [Thermomicrobiales bacterium]
MRTTVTTARFAEVSPHPFARFAGVVYLLYFLTAIAGEILLQQAGISGIGLISADAAALANNLLAHESAFQLGFALSLISLVDYVALTALLYRLLKPVSRSVSLIATYSGLMGLTVQAIGGLFQLAPLVVLRGNPSLSAFDEKQVQALALLALQLQAQAGAIALVFDGVFLLLIGYLIFRATFLPRILGGLVALAGLGWLTYLWPPLARDLTPYIQGLGGLAEGSLMLWLLLIGVDVARWQEQASPGEESLGS